MSETPRRRGRPKGTGIDDSATLREILAMLAANDDLKPTTAIRRTGISDPSVVRRLREKLKQEPQSVAQRDALQRNSKPPNPIRPLSSSVLQTGKTSPRRPSQSPDAPITEPPRIQDTATRTSPSILPAHDGLSRHLETPPKPQTDTTAAPQQKAAPTQPQAQADTIQSQPAAPPPLPPPDPQLEALRLSAEAAAAMSKLYLHCVTNAAHTNPLTLALSAQTMMSQWFAGLVQAQINARQKPKA